MTLLKNNKFPQKSDVLWRKILEKDFQLFPQKFSQIFFYSYQKQVLLLRFSKLLKKERQIYQNGKFGSVVPVKHGVLFSGLIIFVPFWQKKKKKRKERNNLAGTYLPSVVSSRLKTSFS